MKQDKAKARFRIGDYQLRKPDYTQVLIWAEVLEMEPAKLLEHFAEDTGEPRFLVDDGPLCQDSCRLIIQQ